jgi:SAM-dependent methyltransferase
MFKKILIFLKSYPINVLIWKLRCKIFNSKIDELTKWQCFFKDKNGIEIGGPSAIFLENGFFSLYPIINHLDGVNFSSKTVWEGNLSEEKPFLFGNKTGKQIIEEGSFLPSISNNTYDFLLSCNNLEHIANPIKALFEWKRIVKKNGNILLILPNKFANFDINRPFTTINHLIDDYENDITEADTTHLKEVLKLHNINRDPNAGSFKNFETRCYDNLRNRCIHHHVFSIQLLKQIADFCELKVENEYISRTDLFILLIKD